MPIYEQKPKRSKGSHYFQGKFKVLNESRYSGDAKDVWYRSGWEFSFMRRLDHDPRVLKWSSEEVKVPYRDPVTNRLRRYFPDFFVTLREDGGKERKLLIEIKPDAQTKLPKKGKKSNRTYRNEAHTYVRNMAKWEAAQRWCKSNGAEWVLLTEKMLPGFEGLSCKR